MLIRQLFRFHQALGAGQHGKPAGQVSADPGDGTLDLGNQLHHGGQRAVADRSGRDAPGAVDDAVYIHGVDGHGQAGGAQVGKVVFPHPLPQVGVHPVSGFMLRLLFRRVGFDDHQVADAFLQENPQPAVRFLHPGVQPFEGPPEEEGQRDHCRAAGQQDRGEVAVQHNQHRDGSNKPDSHAAEARNQFSVVFSDDAGIICQPVHPFAGVDGADFCVFFPENGFCQLLFEQVFKGGFGAFRQPAVDHIQQDLHRRQQDQQYRVMPKSAAVLIHGAVDHVSRQQGINDAADADQDLHRRQRRYVSFFPPRRPPEPGDCMITHGFSPWRGSGFCPCIVSGRSGGRLRAASGRNTAGRGVLLCCVPFLSGYSLS